MTRAASLASLASPEVLSVDSSNNIGINSTTPDAKLDVVGIVSATSFYGDGANLTNVPAGGLSGTPDITVNNVVGAAATFTGVLTYEDVANVDSLGIITARSGVHFGTAAAGTLVSGDGTGIGIGTASPDKLFHVQASDAGASSNSFDVAILERNDDCYLKILSANNKVGGINFGDAQGSYMGALYYDHTPNALIFNVNEAERLRITSSGNIGIGTNFADFGGGSTGVEIFSAGSVNSFLGLTNSTTGPNGVLHGFNIIMSDNEARLFNRENGAMTFFTNSTERLRIGSDGLLDVSGGIQVSENITPSSGSGVEIFQPDASTGQVQAYNRTSAAWMDLKIKGDNIIFSSQGTESLGIGASIVHFKNTGLVEQETKDFLDTKLGTNGRVSLKNGNVARFTGNETGSTSVNFIDVHSELSVGDTVSFTVIIRPNGAGYINAVFIDSVSIPASDTQLNWQGGSAPSSGSSDGYDVYTFQIIKTGSGTSDYLVLASTPTNYT